MAGVDHGTLRPCEAACVRAGVKALLALCGGMRFEVALANSSHSVRSKRVVRSGETGKLEL